MHVVEFTREIGSRPYGDVYWANCYSSGDWRVEKALAMLVPSVGMQCRAMGMRLAGLLIWSFPTQRLMNAAGVVIVAVRLQLSLQIKGIPKEDAIEILAAQGADEPFHKRMRHGNVRNGFDFVNVKYAQIR